MRTFAPLVYPHKPGMAPLAQRVGARVRRRALPGAVPTATFFPEPDVADYVGAALDGGARVFKAHVQVGGFDPRDPLLRPAGGCSPRPACRSSCTAATARCPARTPASTSFGEVLAAHPRLTAVIAHAGLPEFGAALDLVAPLPERATWTRRWSARRSPNALAPAAAATGPRGSPTSPTGSCWAPTSRTSRTPTPSSCGPIAGWAAADDRLGAPFLRSVLHDAPARLLGETAPR